MVLWTCLRTRYKHLSCKDLWKKFEYEVLQILFLNFIWFDKDWFNTTLWEDNSSVSLYSLNKHGSFNINILLQWEFISKVSSKNLKVLKCVDKIWTRIWLALHIVLSLTFSIYCKKRFYFRSIRFNITSFHCVHVLY